MRAGKIFKKIGDEFVYGGHLLSVGASSIILTIIEIFNLKINWILLVIGYLMSQIVYSFDHLQGAQKDIFSNPQRTNHIIKNIKKQKIILIVYFLLLFIFLFFISNIKIFIIVTCITVLGLFYSICLKKLTQKLPGFKNFFVALVWALSPVLIIDVFYHLGLVFIAPFLLIFLFIFLRWLLNTTFFDIKDIATDQKENLKTLPVVWGEKKLLTFLQLLNFFSFLPLIVGIIWGVLPAFCLGLLIFYFYSLYYLFKTKRAKTYLHLISYVMVDGEYLFWPFIVYLAKIILC